VRAKPTLVEQDSTPLLLPLINRVPNVLETVQEKTAPLGLKYKGITTACTATAGCWHFGKGQ